MATFYCPIELTRADVKAAGRFFFIEVETDCPMKALQMQREIAIEMFGGTAGYARWVPVRDLPTFEYMQELREAFGRKSRRGAKSIPGYTLPEERSALAAA